MGSISRHLDILTVPCPQRVLMVRVQVSTPMVAWVLDSRCSCSGEWQTLEKRVVFPTPTSPTRMTLKVGLLAA